MAVFAGNVVTLNGSVYIQKPSESNLSILQQGDQVFINDTIITGPDGQLTVKLEDGQTLVMGRDSKMLLNEGLIGSQSDASAELETLQEAVLAGDFDLLEDTAAGAENLSPESALSAASERVERDRAQGEVTSGFETSTPQQVLISTERDLVELDDILEPVQSTFQITSLPQYGDLYLDGRKLEIGDVVDNVANVRIQVDPARLPELGFNAANDFRAEGYRDNTVSSFTTASGLMISAGVFSGDKPDASSNLTPANLYYDSARNETGLGIGGDREINASSKEYIAIQFPEDVVSSKVIFGSVYGNYQDTHRADARINIIAFKDGEQVYEIDFNDTYNGSGIFEAPVDVEDGYDELRVFTLADRNSNITLQSVEVENVLVNDRFGYLEVGSDEARDTDLLVSSSGSVMDETLVAESPDLADTIEINTSGQRVLVNQFDPSQDTLDVKAVLDDSVNANNLDQYIKMASIDSDADGVNDSTLLTLDSNGHRSGGDITYVYLDNALSNEWNIDADSDARGNFDIDS